MELSKKITICPLLSTGQRNVVIIFFVRCYLVLNFSKEFFVACIMVMWLKYVIPRGKGGSTRMLHTNMSQNQNCPLYQFYMFY